MVAHAEPADDTAAGVAAEAGTIGVAVLAARLQLRERIVAALTRDGLEILIEAASAIDLEERHDLSPADALVVAFDGPGRSAGSMVRELATRHAGAPIVVVTSPALAGKLVRGVLRSRVEAVVVSSKIEEALAPTVRAVCADQVVFPRTERRHVKTPVFSHREKEVLRLMVLGGTNDEIAESLFLATSTVKSHLTSAFAKLEVSSRSEAAALLLDPVEPIGRAVLSDGLQAPVQAIR